MGWEATKLGSPSRRERLKTLGVAIAHIIGRRPSFCPRGDRQLPVARGEGHRLFRGRGSLAGEGEAGGRCRVRLDHARLSDAGHERSYSVPVTEVTVTVHLIGITVKLRNYAKLR